MSCGKHLLAHSWDEGFNGLYCVTCGYGPPPSMADYRYVLAMLGVTKPRKLKASNTSKRKTVYRRDGNRCLECGTRENLTLDHIVPLSRGGTNAISNLQTLCATCNMRKADSTVRY